MPKHPARYARRRNKARRLACALKQLVLPPSIQLARARANAIADQQRYPQPPKYRYWHSDPHPIQPLCYSAPTVHDFLRGK